MLSSLLRSALVLAAVCCLTCEADVGVISVLKVGWTDEETCTEDNSSEQLANTAGALEALANRCNSTKVCGVDKEIFSADPCPDTYKYIQTTYTCLPARRVEVCEKEEETIRCEQKEVIKVIGAFYGRNDRTTCAENHSTDQVNKVNCFKTTATSMVADSCDGKRRCTVYATNDVFGDPCPGIYKYLEVAYTCE